MRLKKFAFLFIAIVSYSVAIAQASLTVGPYLQSPTPSSIKVLWRTDSTTIGNVMYGTSIGNLTLTATDTALTARHSVKISGLLPYTKYYYAVYNGNTKMEGDDSEHWFRTFPTPGTEQHIRAWAIGDFGKGNSKQVAVRDSYLNFDTTETNLWLWLGDNVYNDGTEPEYLTKVFDSVYGYQKVMKHMPFLPAPGNHDYNSISPVVNSKPPLTHTGPYYDFVDVYQNAEAGGVATHHELFYSYDYGNAHFISLNTEVGSALGAAADDWTGASIIYPFNGSPLTQWLTQDLQANTKTWTIIYFHQPPYTDGSHESTAFYEVYMKAMRQYFAPIFDQFGVDLVICGHTHVYERSYLVRGSYGNPTDITPANYVQNTTGHDETNPSEAYVKYTQGSTANYGTVYVNNGNSGSSESAPNFTHPYMYSEYGCDTCCGSFVLDITGNRLDGRHIDMHGVEQDHFTIKKINGVPQGVNELSGSNVTGLKVVPNPFKNSTQLTFELIKAEEVKIQLVDINGKLIDVFAGNLQAGPHNYEVNADVLKLAKGAYILNVTSGQSNTTKTVIRVD